jgi:glycosyltransferase involved in cell wall biosynthesis
VSEGTNSEDGRAGAGLSGHDVVCVGFADWDSDLKTNQHHLLSRLALRNRVLFVESLGLRQPRMAGSDLRRIRRRLVNGLGPPREVDGLHVVSPLVVPLHRYAAVRALNDRLLPRLVGRAASGLGMQRAILWAYVPQAEILIDRLEPGLVVYHCVDDIGAQKGIDFASFRAAESRFAARADLVFASSAPLAERLSQFNDRVITMTNVADTKLFAAALDPGDVDAELALLPQPRIVFTGAIVTTKLDMNLLVQLARERTDWSIVLVGPIGPGDPSTDVSPLEAEPNIHLLGPRPYGRLPEVLRGADAAIIPYARNALTDSIFPMKVYEYLSAGLPLVSTPIPSLDGVEGIVTAADAGAMTARLDELLASDTPALRQERSRLAAGHSWDARLEEIGRAIAAHE